MVDVAHECRFAGSRPVLPIFSSMVFNPVGRNKKRKSFLVVKGSPENVILNDAQNHIEKYLPNNKKKKADISDILTSSLLLFFYRMAVRTRVEGFFVFIFQEKMAWNKNTNSPQDTISY